MADLFLSARRRIDGHLEAIAAEQSTPTAASEIPARIVAIQEILYALGQQALDENAEWLILHRSRPLEPIMAG